MHGGIPPVPLYACLWGELQLLQHFQDMEAYKNMEFKG
jgi:hypothetical protein